MGKNTNHDDKQQNQNSEWSDAYNEDKNNK